MAMPNKLNFVSEFNYQIDHLENSKEYYTSNIHKYPAKMVKFIPQLLIPKFADKNDLILDPFCGSGTVLMNARLMGINSIGIDINPLAVLISKVKTQRYNTTKLRIHFQYLMESIYKFKGKPEIPRFQNMDFWFDKKYQIQLGKILACIKKNSKGKYRDFFLVCFSTIIRRASNADPDILPPVKTKRMKKIIQNRKLNIVKMYEDAVQKNIMRVEKFSGKCPHDTFVKVFEDDSRKISVENNTVDLVLTSPPYISAQKYARSLKLETYWLGLTNQKKFREIDSSTIGTESIKIKKSDNIFTGIESADRLINLIRVKNKERALIFSNYVNDMSKVFSEIKRVLRPNHYFILVIGDNTVCKYRIPSNVIMKEIAQKKGFKLVKQYYDKIRYRGFTRQRNKTAGSIDYEWIMIFRKIR